MPVFEYKCQECSKRFAKLVGMTADSSDPVCPQCGSVSVDKLISKFTRGRGEDEVLESFEDAATTADMDDPKAMSKLMREMGRTLAEDGEGDIDEMIDEAEKEAYDGTGACDSGDAEFA
jgi:putative FmdB family regulatory protein